MPEIMLTLCLLLHFLTSGGNCQTANAEGASSISMTARETCLCAQGFCDSGWIQYKNSCYKPVHEHVSWTKAEANCLSFKSHLASIHSSEENDFVFILMGKPQDPYNGGSYWIGLHDIFQEGKYMWTDGSEMTFKTFGIGQPDNNGNNENYIGSWYIENGHVTWNDYSGRYFFPYVCKYTLGRRLCNTDV
ncbi:C-type lectin lectoxin-Thr1-like isoform X2 [Ambystoma mexicanum]|uniref:C-type lectin lectoxin-Thr1-like isoform X2 n=1 Tax=Ambystoma mexicanum TaxID=8296 RepID=UPI0037E95569